MDILERIEAKWSDEGFWSNGTKDGINSALDKLKQLGISDIDAEALVLLIMDAARNEYGD